MLLAPNLRFSDAVVNANVSGFKLLGGFRETPVYQYILQEVILSRGQGDLKLKREQKEALLDIVLNDQDWLIVLSTSYTTLHHFVKVNAPQGFRPEAKPEEAHQKAPRMSARYLTIIP